VDLPDLFAPLASPRNASLAYAICYVLLMYGSLRHVQKALVSESVDRARAASGALRIALPMDARAVEVVGSVSAR